MSSLSQTRLLTLWTATTFAVVVALMTHLSLRFQIARLGYALADARTQHRRLTEDHRLLATERATLRHPARIRTLAQTRFAMHEPSQLETLSLNGQTRMVSGRAQ